MVQKIEAALHDINERGNLSKRNDYDIVGRLNRLRNKL